MVCWRNPNDTTTLNLNLTYSFVLLLAQPDLWPLYIASIAVIAVGTAAVVAHMVARRNRPPS